MTDSPDTQTRRAYKKPTLRSHGPLAVVTRAVGKTGKNDAGTKSGMNMTGL